VAFNSVPMDEQSTGPGDDEVARLCASHEHMGIDSLRNSPLNVSTPGPGWREYQHSQGRNGVGMCRRRGRPPRLFEATRRAVEGLGVEVFRSGTRWPKSGV
jgi:hypothetical protein